MGECQSVCCEPDGKFVHGIMEQKNSELSKKIQLKNFPKKVQSTEKKSPKRSKANTALKQSHSTTTPLTLANSAMA